MTLHPSRRDTAAGLLATGAAHGLHAHPLGPVTPQPSLDAVARTRGLRFGSAAAASATTSARAGGSIDNPAYAAVIAGECGLIVPESEMKWQALQPTPGPYRFGLADRLMAWAGSNGMAVRGHNLLWLQAKWLPAWVNAYDFGSRPASAAERLIAGHVRTTCARYGDRLTSWDVINEAVDPATGEMWPTVFTPLLGDRVFDIAFHTARDVLPETPLVYNDFMGWTADSERHRAAVLKLLETLKARGVPVDWLGLQSHLGQGGRKPVGPVQEGAWRWFLQGATGMGYGLVASELDVGDTQFAASDVAIRDAEVAALARRYLDLTLSFPQVRALLCWGMVDRSSWLQAFTPRADHLEKRPSPYDDAYRPKPLREAIASALRNAPVRPA